MAKERAKDPIWDKIVERFDVHPEAHKSRIGKAVRQLKQMGATPAEIDFRLQVCRGKWGSKYECTIEAFCKHYLSFTTTKRSGFDSVLNGMGDQ